MCSSPEVNTITLLLRDDMGKLKEVLCYYPSKIPVEFNGECPDCGSDTVDGESIDICTYSPVICNTCGWAPCDESC